MTWAWLSVHSPVCPRVVYDKSKCAVELALATFSLAMRALRPYQITLLCVSFPIDQNHLIRKSDLQPAHPSCSPHTRETASARQPYFVKTLTNRAVHLVPIAFPQKRASNRSEVCLKFLKKSSENVSAQSIRKRVVRCGALAHVALALLLKLIDVSLSQPHRGDDVC